MNAFLSHRSIAKRALRTCATPNRKTDYSGFLIALVVGLVLLAWAVTDVIGGIIK